MNELKHKARENQEKFDNAVVAEILKAKAAWIHHCLAAILPPELYELAKADNELERVKTWTKAQGYEWREYVGESRLVKGDQVVARFKPELQGGRIDPHIAFDAIVKGLPISLA